MKTVLDARVLGGLVLFLIFLIRGFYLQVQDRQAKREAKAKAREKMSKKGSFNEE